MSMVPAEDICYLAQQSSERINMILSGMTAIMNDTNNKIELMESQGWFQRMVKTVTGKNKATKAEIQQNHDKLNAYMSEAIAELYNQNCIEHQVIISLGNQLNEIYADHLQLKQMLGAFISKLNEKIESVDNFHMLIEEISQGMYGNRHPIVSVVYVLSMMDKRMLLDKRKCDIIVQALRNNGILNTKPITLLECFINVMDLNSDEVGRFYLEVQTIKENYFADMILRLMDKMYFLTEGEQRFIHKKREVRKVIAEEDYDENSILTTEDIFDEFLIAKQGVLREFMEVLEVQDNDSKKKLENNEDIGEELENLATEERECIDKEKAENVNWVKNDDDISDDTYEAIYRRCENFLIIYGESKFDITYKLKEGLGILHSNKIYLAHDDTILKTGKNGFAITSDGIYCRNLMETKVNFTSYFELAETDSIYWRGSNIYADDKCLAYFTGSDEEKENLVGLFEGIKFILNGCGLKRMLEIIRGN